MLGASCRQKSHKNKKSNSTNTNSGNKNGKNSHTFGLIVISSSSPGTSSCGGMQQERNVGRMPRLALGCFDKARLLEADRIAVCAPRLFSTPTLLGLGCC